MEASEGPSITAEAEDTAEEALTATIPTVVEQARKLAALRRQLRALEEEVARQTQVVLTLFQGVGDLTGVRLQTGDAVRRTLTTVASPISVAALRANVPDPERFIVEVVDGKRLRADNERLWFDLAKPRSHETITVRLAKEGGAPRASGSTIRD